MRSLTIQKNNTESSSTILGHWTISAIYSPAYEETQLVYILGSHDNVNFGRILKNGEPLALTINELYTIHIFDSDSFEGIQQFKLQLANTPATEDITFPIHFKDY